MKTADPKLGKYLYTLRLERGFTNVAEYLNRYELPLSDVYYREIEAGKKQVSLDKAYDLCQALDADLRAFYYYLLSDILPEKVLEELVRPVYRETFSNIEERQAVLERDRRIFGDAFAKALLSDTFIADDRVVDFLSEHPEFMPVLHFLYGTESTNEAELGIVMRRNKLPGDPVALARQFHELGIIRMVISKEGGARWKLSRRFPTFRLPEGKKGKALKDNFLHRELARSVEQPRASDPLDGQGAFIQSGIYALSPRSVEYVKQRIVGLLAELEAAEVPLSHGESVPYFFALVLALRSNYSSLPEKEVEDE